MNRSDRALSFRVEKFDWFFPKERKNQEEAEKWSEKRSEKWNWEVGRFQGRSTAIIPCLLTAKVEIYIYVYTWSEAGPRKKSNNSLLYRPSLRYIAAIKLTLRFVKPDAKFRENFLSSPLPLIILQLYKQNIGCFRIPRVYPLEKKEKF